MLFDEKIKILIKDYDVRVWEYQSEYKKDDLLNEISKLKNRSDSEILLIRDFSRWHCKI